MHIDLCSITQTSHNIASLSLNVPRQIFLWKYSIFTVLGDSWNSKKQCWSQKEKRKENSFGLDNIALCSIYLQSISLLVSKHSTLMSSSFLFFQHLISSGAKLTISDDSHGIGDVGHWYHHLQQFLESHNIKDLYFLERVRLTDGKVTSKKLENCLDHPFWEHCKDALEKGY